MAFQAAPSPRAGRIIYENAGRGAPRERQRAFNQTPHPPYVVLPQRELELNAFALQEVADVERTSRGAGAVFETKITYTHGGEADRERVVAVTSDRRQE